ncbi:hypothetical protein HPB48_006033 [Haemaphysalis longicornis]|uniref:Transmembrane protein 208 n=1 Tax=Haemaphysalis longicornis TaxID=44386 RepID=A0A9J6FKV0_HAELO|nr:hypothetical protein HPB48_006033 [Haemaphysalis longicornis]
MPPKKGKQGPKGHKKIVRDNKKTIRFCSTVAVAALSIHLLEHLLLWRHLITTSYVLLYLFTLLVYVGCIQTMRYMARASYSDDGKLLDAGINLNTAGVGKHSQDLIILTACAQTLSLVTTYAWCIYWLLALGRSFYLFWVNVLGPRFFQPRPAEFDEKELKTSEREAGER